MCVSVCVWGGAALHVFSAIPFLLSWQKWLCWPTFTRCISSVTLFTFYRQWRSVTPHHTPLVPLNRLPAPPSPPPDKLLHRQAKERQSLKRAHVYKNNNHDTVYYGHKWPRSEQIHVQYMYIKGKYTKCIQSSVIFFFLFKCIQLDGMQKMLGVFYVFWFILKHGDLR